jgi:hypothetical protein
MPDSYNRTERYLGSVLRKFPGMRRFAKASYQSLSYLISRKMPVDYEAFVSAAMKVPGAETFFGYYDKSPVNSSGSHILFHISTRPTHRKPDPAEPIKVGLKKMNSDEIPITYESRAYNWQQGCRTHWLNETEFIFNNFNRDTGAFFSQIVNIRQSEQNRILDFPIYESGEGLGLSLNFNRLALLRPDYGYRNIIDGGAYVLPDDSEDGVFICDLLNNKMELLISLEFLKNLCNVGNLDAHKVNHIMLNPDRSGFVFLYRYFIRGRKFDCLISSNIKGEDIRVLSSNEIISHYCWISPSDIVAYMKGPDQKERYYCISANTGDTVVYGAGIIDQFGDGHPSYIKGNLIFDTYPDKSRHKKLLAYHPGSDRVREIGRFYESFKYRGETRCDLHPRHLINTSLVSVDSVHEGKRQMYLVELDKEKE